MKQKYMNRLLWAARWKLPRAEADSVLEDYREMIRENPRSEKELYQDFGRPGQAIQMLVQPGTYYRWLFLFLLLTAYLLLYAAVPIWEVQELFHRIRIPLTEILLVFGSVLSFAWFQREGVREKNGLPVPKGLLPMLLLPMLGTILAWAIIWWMLFDISSFFRLMEATNGAFCGQSVHQILECNILIAGLTGVFGLTKARVGDRRWRALYLSSLAVAALSVSVYLMLTNMDHSTADFAVWRSCLTEYIGLTALGLAGTGISFL